MVRKPRIQPRPPSDWDAEVLDVLSVMMRQGGSEAAESNQAGAPRVVNALAVLMRYPALAKAFLTFNRHLLFNSSLSDRIRELLILRIAWLRRAEYEWAQHVLLAQKAGLRKEEIEAVKEGPVLPCGRPWTRPCSLRWTSCMRTRSSPTRPGMCLRPVLTNAN
jgi:4-carboxymuconolactone decarboxylase